MDSEKVTELAYVQIANERIAALTAEVERLRGVLEYILDERVSLLAIRDAARAALGGEE